MKTREKKNDQRFRRIETFCRIQIEPDMEEVRLTFDCYQQPLMTLIGDELIHMALCRDVDREGETLVLIGCDLQLMYLSDLEDTLRAIAENENYTLTFME